MNDILGDRGMLEVEALPFWTGPIKIWPLMGGITNRNYGVQRADGQRFAVRLGQDLPHHGVMRFNEQEAARAAAQAGISPRIMFTAPGVMISRLLPGRNLTEAEVRAPHNLPRILALVQRCHTAMAAHLRGPLLAFWVFHVNRSYFAALEAAPSAAARELLRLTGLNEMLERKVGKVELVFGHNDLLPGNIFDDGARLWLLDWDYAGFNSPLFDLANLSANNGFSAVDDEGLLAGYFGAAQGEAEMAGFRAFKCASLLREALWSGVSERSSSIDFDYAGYTRTLLGRLDDAVAALA